MPSGGFWRKPVTRMYSYNLDLGEHYYSPMTSYLDTERGTRGETPGALTFSERLARKWVNGRRYEATELRDRYARSSSMAREATQASTAAASSETAGSTVARSARAMSERPTQGPVTSAWLNRRAMQEQASASSAVAQTEKKSVRIESTQAKSTQQQGSSTTVKHTACECGCDESANASATSKTALMAKQKMADQRAAFLSGYSSSSQQKAVRYVYYVS